MQNTGISIVSSSATDILLDENKNVISKQAGGPLYFIQQAVEKLSISSLIFDNGPVPVEILITKNGEFGKISSPSATKNFPIKEVSEYTIVSTLLREWDLKNIRDYKGKLFLDLQGYVRDGNDFGKKQKWNEILLFAEYIFCIKGTKEEINYIPKSVVKKQKKKILLVTDGEKNIELFCEGKKYLITPTKIQQIKNTIGAGDTFFAYFVIALYNGQMPNKAVEYASKMTTKFLKGK